MLTSAGTSNPTTDNWNFIFCNENGDKITTKVGTLLKSGLTKVLGLPLNVSVYRQMAVMLADHKKFNIEQYESPQESDIVDLQTGHSTLTSHTHYALNANLTGPLTRGSAVNFYQCSLDWQNFFGYRDDPLDTLVNSDNVTENEPTMPRVTIPRNFAPNREVPSTHLDQSTALQALRSVKGDIHARFKSKLQRDTLAILSNKNNSIISLPTGFGKTLLVLVDAKLNGGILYIPLFRSLYEDIKTRAVGANIQFSEFADWELNSGQKPMYICTPETLDHYENRVKLRNMIDEHRGIRKIIIDECNEIVLSHSYRNCVLQLYTLPELGIPIKLVSATIPTRHMKEMAFRFGIDFESVNASGLPAHTIYRFVQSNCSSNLNHSEDQCARRMRNELYEKISNESILQTGKKYVYLF